MDKGPGGGDGEPLNQAMLRRGRIHVAGVEALEEWWEKG